MRRRALAMPVRAAPVAIEPRPAARSGSVVVPVDANVVAGVAAAVAGAAGVVVVASGGLRKVRHAATPRTRFRSSSMGQVSPSWPSQLMSKPSTQLNPHVGGPLMMK